jgi:hypothetical protein
VASGISISANGASAVVAGVMANNVGGISAINISEIMKAQSIGGLLNVES